MSCRLGYVDDVPVYAGQMTVGFPRSAAGNTLEFAHIILIGNLSTFGVHLSLA